MPAKTTLCFVSILLSLSFLSVTYGQGKLSRARNSTRQEKPTTARKSPTEVARETKQPPRTGQLNQVRAATGHKNQNAKPGRDPHVGSGSRPKRPHNRRRNPRRRRPVHGGFVPVNFCHTPTPVFVEQNVYQSAIVPVPVPAIQPVLATPVRPSLVIAESRNIANEPFSEPYVANWFQDWNARISVFGGSDFDDLSQFGLDVLFQDQGGVGIESSVRTLRESGYSFRDHLWLGDVNLLYEAISNSNFRGRLGLGVNWLGDQYGGEAGFNLTAGFDLKLTENWLVTGEGDVGTLGDADFSHYRFSLGRRFDNTTWNTGFDRTNIGGVKLDSVFTGLQFRF